MLDKNLNIMVLDDDPFILKMMQLMLQQRGLTKVQTFELARDALEECSTGIRPDILFLDINMPDIDGIQVLRLMHQSNFSGSIIFLSGEDELMHKTLFKLASLQGLNVIGSLHKPIQADALNHQLARTQKRFLHHLQSSHQRHQALKLDSRQLVMALHHRELTNFYQPKVSLRTGLWLGVECLVRWQHPELGMISPKQFVPLAEESNLITDITRQVIKQSIEDFHDWDPEQMPKISINLSMQDLTDVNFSDFLIQTTQMQHFSPRQITFEITESRLAKDLAPVLDILARLRLHRFKLSIDDFGTGHSSLLQLRDLPFDELKIDQGFVHDAHNEHRMNAIVKASIALAKHLEMESVAEGVETTEDWRNMQTLGADIAQGYFIAKPMPFAELENWHQQWRQRIQQENLLTPLI